MMAELAVVGNFQRWSSIENRLMVVKEEGVGRGMDWECGINRCNLLHIEWMENKVVLYSTGNYIHCPGINHSGKEYEEEGIYLSIYLSIYLYTHAHRHI